MPNRNVLPNAALAMNPRVQFAGWLKRAHPQVFEAAVTFAQQTPGGRRELAAEQAALGFLDWDIVGIAEPVQATTETKSTWQKLLDGAITFGTGFLTLKNQKDMLELNIERAKMGLPPLDAADTAPVIRTQIDIDPALARDLASNVGSSINRNMLIFGGLALVVLFFMMRR